MIGGCIVTAHTRRLINIAAKRSRELPEHVARAVLIGISKPPTAQASLGQQM
jgi:hypothetical protein